MTGDAVKVDEILVLGFIPAIMGSALVRLSEPEQPAPVVPETLLVIEQIPTTLRLRFAAERIENWSYARYVIARAAGDWARVPGIDFGRWPSIPLDQLPVGMSVRVRHIPIYAQAPFQKKVWPWWQLPKKKNWLTPPPRDVH